VYSYQKALITIKISLGAALGGARVTGYSNLEIYLLWRHPWSSGVQLVRV